MKHLERNCRTIYYAQYAGKVENSEGGIYTGEYTVSYTTPTAIRMNVSAAYGALNTGHPAINPEYTRTLVTADMDCPITEESVLWIDKPITGKHNYIVTAVSRSINSITISARKVDVGE